MDSMGIGMLGFGSIGKVHALAYREIPSLYPSLPGYHLAAVCTNSPETAQAASKEGGFCPRVFQDPRSPGRPECHRRGLRSAQPRPQAGHTGVPGCGKTRVLREAAGPLIRGGT